MGKTKKDEHTSRRRSDAAKKEKKITAEEDEDAETEKLLKRKKSRKISPKTFFFFYQLPIRVLYMFSSISYPYRRQGRTFSAMMPMTWYQFIPWLRTVQSLTATTTAFFEGEQTMNWPP
jgi:hypothetical protein